jgi:hypothetical protein
MNRKAPPGDASARLLTGRREELTDEPNYSPPCVSQREGVLLWELAILRIIQRPFGAAFWFLEQKMARLSDELERRHT